MTYQPNCPTVTPRERAKKMSGADWSPVTVTSFYGMRRTSLILVLILGSTAMPKATSFSVEAETMLRSNLLTNYSADVRPEGNTQIRLSFSMTSIKNLNIRTQQFTPTGWWSMRWSDQRLTWNRTDYEGIPVLQILPDKIWTPTLVVDNSVNDLSAIDEDTIPVRVDTVGTVTWNPPGLLTLTCEMDISYFPFDSQTCTIQVTSFGYTIQELDILVYGDGVVLTYFEPNGEWKLQDIWNRRETFIEDGYEYAKIFYYFHLKRMPLYYGLNMVLPVIITSFLTLFVFLLPAESGEKIGYCLTVLLAFMVILTLIATDLPTSAEYTSILEVYIAVVLIMGGLSVVLSILVLHLYFLPEDKPIPNYIQKLTRLGFFICCYESCCRRKVNPENSDLDSGKGSQKRTGKDQKDPLDLQERSQPAVQRHDSFIYPSHWSKKPGDLGYRPRSALSAREVATSSGDAPITWQVVSQVLDGVLLRIYMLFLVVSSIAIMVVLAA